MSSPNSGYNEGGTQPPTPPPAPSAPQAPAQPNPDPYGYGVEGSANPAPPHAAYGQQAPYGHDPAYGTTETESAPGVAAAFGGPPSPPSLDNPHVVQSDVNAKDGLSKCGRCGRSEERRVGREGR